MKRLCELYRRPIQVCVRLRVMDPQVAEDRTQQFIEHLLKPGQFATFERRPGSKFRSYLVKSLDNFLRDLAAKDNAQKRGGGVEHVSIDLPTEDGGARPPAPPTESARVLDREVALDIHARIISRQQEKYIKAGKQGRLEALKGFLFGEPPPNGFGAIAEELSVTANAVRQELWRMRDDYYDSFRAEVAQTVGNTREEVDEETRYLLSLLPDEYGTGDR